MQSVAAFNQALIRKNIPVELFKGDGYFYFMPTIDIPFEPESIMVCHFTHLSRESWDNIFNDVVKLYEEFIDERTKPIEPEGSRTIN